MSKVVRITLWTLLMVYGIYGFGQANAQATLHHTPPGSCPAAFLACIFYGGDSDWNVVGGNIAYLPISGPPAAISAVYDNVSFTASQTVKGVFANVLVNPTELALYTSAYWEIRVGVELGTGGTLIASGTCSGNIYHTSGNGQNANSNIGVWFACDLPSINLSAGTYWFTLVPLATGATYNIFEWTTSASVPYVGQHQAGCDGFGPPGGCAYYNSPPSAFNYVNTFDPSAALPYPTAASPSGAFSFGLY